MKKQLSDEQTDQFMRRLINDASLDDASINEIADSPAMWWAVHRNINERKSLTVSPWPPIAKFWRWALVGVPTVAAAALLISLFVFQPVNVDDRAASVENPVSNESTDTGLIATANEIPSTLETIPSADVNRDVRPVAPAPRIAKFVNRKPRLTRSSVETVAGGKSTEIKTDFIALSYARNPESGQIVRVKVPSSMMVTLGLVASVSRPSSLVDAEVVVGDDGLTRAIRFIRTN